MLKRIIMICVLAAVLALCPGAALGEEAVPSPDPGEIPVLSGEPGPDPALSPASESPANEAPSILSAEASPSSVPLGEPVLFTLLSDPSAEFVCLCAENGKPVKTWAADDASSLSDGLRVWSLSYTIQRMGSRRLSFRASADGSSFGPRARLELPVTAPVVRSVQLPWDSVFKGERLSFSAVTSPAVSHLSLCAENGRPVKTWAAADASSLSGGQRLWSLRWAFSGLGDRRLSLRASADGSAFGPGFPFSLRVLDLRVRSAQADRNPAVTGDPLFFTCSTAPEAAFLGLFAENGRLVKSWPAEGCSSLEGDARLWTVKYSFSAAGNRAVSLRAGLAEDRFASGQVLRLTVIPAPRVLRARADRDAVPRNRRVTFTVLTPASAQYLRLYAENGKPVRTWTASAASSTDGSERTWTLAYACSGVGNRRLTFRGSLDGDRYYAGKAVSLRVYAEPESLALEDLTLGQGESRPLTLSISPANAESEYAWESSDPARAQVDQSGLVQGLRTGSATITVTSSNGKSASCLVTVKDAPGSIQADPASLRLEVTQQAQLGWTLGGRDSAGSVRFEDYDASLLEVSPSGLVTALKPGETKITLRTYNDRTASVSVQIVPEALTLTPPKAELRTGEVLQLAATRAGRPARDVRFSSSDPKVASVDASGLVTALTEGTCAITGKTPDGLSASCALQVKPRPARILLPEDMTLGLAELRTFSVEVLTEAGEPYPCQYSLESSDPSVVSVSGLALVAEGLGEAKVTVRAEDLSASFRVRVIPYGEAHPAQVFAHRGASAYAPANTLSAFRLADRLGADGVELDVHRSRDGYLVVLHDPTIPYNGKARPVAELTLAQIQSVDLGGDCVPTLRQALSCIAGTGMSVQVELKAEGVAADSVRLVRELGLMDRAIFISFSLSELSDARREDPSARLGYIHRNAESGLAQTAQKYGLYAVVPKYTVVTEKYVAAAHRAGVKVGVWTVNSASDAVSMARMGVDFIASDAPDVVMRAIR